MRISNATYRLVGELFGGRGIFDLFGKSLRSRAETIARIEAAGEPGAAVYLAIFALDAEAPLRDRAAQAARVLLASVRPDDLFLLDQGARRMDFYYEPASLAWINLKPDKLSILQQHTNGGEALLGMFSFHQNGRVREESVRLLGRMHGGAELPYLLIRLNDWVPVVRSVASEAVRGRLVPAYAGSFAQNISLVHRLMSWNRADHSSMLDWIAEYLRKPECGAAVADILASPDMRARRLMFRLVAWPQQEGFADFLQRALKDTDPTIRLWAIRQARLHLTGADAAGMARIGIGDRYSRVRAQAAYIYVEQLPDESAPVLKAALMDIAPTVRAIGRFYLSKVEVIDFKSFYRARLGSESIREMAIAIAALGDVGDAGDADFLAHHARDASSRIRVAALQALARLDGDRFIDQFMSALTDPSPAAAKEAARALSARASLLDLEAIWNDLWKPHPAMARIRMLAMLLNAPKWDSIYYAITLLAHSDPSVVSLARNHVNKWIQNFNRSGVQPAKAQQTRLLGAMDGHGQLLEAHVAKTVRFLLT
jgi:HEAT repeat protein